MFVPIGGQVTRAGDPEAIGLDHHTLPALGYHVLQRINRERLDCAPYAPCKELIRDTHHIPHVSHRQIFATVAEGNA